MSKFSDWLAPITTMTGFVTAIVLFIFNLQDWANDPNMLHIFSVVAFSLFVLGILWFFIRSSVPAFWRWTSLVVLFVFSALFFLWAGTWLTDSSKIRVEKDMFAPEQAAARAFRYQGVDDPSVGEGTGWFEVSTKLDNGSLDTSYTLNYDIPLGSKGFAGIAIWFTNPQDFTGFNHIELKIKFKNENARCRFILKDSFRSYGEVILGDGKLVAATPDEQSVKIQISKYFSNIALNSVREINLDATGYFFTGNNSFTVSHIRFVK